MVCQGLEAKRLGNATIEGDESDYRGLLGNDALQSINFLTADIIYR